jgi:sodium transport system permease protein
MLLLAVMALILLVGQPLQAYDLIGGLLVTEWILIAGPVLVLLRFGGLAARPVLSLTAPRQGSLIGALLVGLSAWYLVGLLVETVQQRVLPIPPEVLRELQRLLAGGGRSLALDLLALAVSPAICEELLFRGVVLRASLATLRPSTAILLNGLLFGIFHLSIYRFMPTAILGMLLALTVVRSRSILPAMLFHLVNNGTTLIVARQLGVAEMDSAMPGWVSVPAAVLFTAGLLLVLRRRPAR